MALKIRQKKKDTSAAHPKYSSSAPGHWSDQYREDNDKGVRKSFIAIIAVMAAIVLILVLATVSSIMKVAAPEQQIDAADTFAITSYEQQEMAEVADRFAKGVLTYAYCSDKSFAEQGKNVALACLASNTSVYRNLQNMAQVNPVISPDNLAVIVTTPQLQGATQVYVGTFTYNLDAVAADTSDTTLSEDGSFIDAGYNMNLTFTKATSEDGSESAWKITDVTINSNA